MCLQCVLVRLLQRAGGLPRARQTQEQGSGEGKVSGRHRLTSVCPPKLLPGGRGSALLPSPPHSGASPTPLAAASYHRPRQPLPALRPWVQVDRTNPSRAEAPNLPAPSCLDLWALPWATSRARCLTRRGWALGHMSVTLVCSTNVCEASAMNHAVLKAGIWQRTK